MGFVRHCKFNNFLKNYIRLILDWSCNKKWLLIYVTIFIKGITEFPNHIYLSMIWRTMVNKI
jgi:hypothetical protein